MTTTNKPLGVINNNPGNIRFCAHNKWKGMTGRVNGFCQFSSMAYGYRAMFVLIRSYIKNGVCTIDDICRRWAPPSENLTDMYISNVCINMHKPASYVIRLDNVCDMVMIVTAIAINEIGADWVKDNDIRQGLLLFAGCKL